MTETRKEANRIGFNQQEKDLLDGEEFVGLGVLGKFDTIHLPRISTKQKLKTIKASQKNSHQSISNKHTLGTASSFAFTPLRGIELLNPSAIQPQDITTGSKS